jgi:hypothetical protein
VEVVNTRQWCKEVEERKRETGNWDVQAKRLEKGKLGNGK